MGVIPYVCTLKLFSQPLSLSYTVSVSEYRALPNIRVGAQALPAFHTLGIHIQVLVPLYSVISVAVYPPQVMTPGALPVMPTPDNILDHQLRAKANILITVPTFLSTWSGSSKALQLLKTLVSVVSLYCLDNCIWYYLCLWI